MSPNFMSPSCCSVKQANGAVFEAPDRDGKEGCRTVSVVTSMRITTTVSGTASGSGSVDGEHRRNLVRVFSNMKR